MKPVATINTIWLSAFMDGETPLINSQGQSEGDLVEEHLFYYQTTRQILRGEATACGTHETLSWHREQMSVLWAKVDAAGNANTP